MTTNANHNATSKSDVAWLIERPVPGERPEWWGWDEGREAWTGDHQDARRFATKEAAQEVADVFGFEDFTITEHVWVSQPQ